MRITGGQVFDLREGFVEREIRTDGALLSAASGDGRVLDASGCYVIPGLIDVHFHGCVGEDFSDATPDGLQRIADYELSRGVTSICPAGMTLPEDQLTRICENAAAHRAGAAHGADLAGLHLEGPFLCDAKKGAQNGAFLHDPDIDMLRRLQKAAQGIQQRRVLEFAVSDCGRLRSDVQKQRLEVRQRLQTRKVLRRGIGDLKRVQRGHARE